LSSDARRGTFLSDACLAYFVSVQQLFGSSRFNELFEFDFCAVGFGMIALYICLIPMTSGVRSRLWRRGNTIHASQLCHLEPLQCRARGTSLMTPEAERSLAKQVALHWLWILQSVGIAGADLRSLSYPCRLFRLAHCFFRLAPFDCASLS